jgi:hypothetical protein
MQTPIGEFTALKSAGKKGLAPLEFGEEFV